MIALDCKYGLHWLVHWLLTLDCIGLNCIGLHWIALDWIALDCIEQRLLTLDCIDIECGLNVCID